MSGPSLPTAYSWGSRAPSPLSLAPVAAHLCLSHKTAGPARTSPLHPAPAAPLSWVSLWASASGRGRSAGCLFLPAARRKSLLLPLIPK